VIWGTEIGGGRHWRPVAAAMAILAAFSGAAVPPLGGGCATPPRPPAVTWSDSAVYQAAASCRRLFADPRFDVEAQAPVDNGSCSVPTPILFKGLRTQPPLSFAPSPFIACPVAEPLERWLSGSVQPAAWRNLGAPVVRIIVASSYDCRTINSEPGERLSNHAAGAAVDLSEFVTATGERIRVQDHWSRNDRESAFLHQAFRGACGLFGTALGPDYNGRHHSHFHLDIQRRTEPFCR
jgi:hypothetical protein